MPPMGVHVSPLFHKLHSQLHACAHMILTVTILTRLYPPLGEVKAYPLK